MNILRDFTAYLKAVFAESQRLVFTAFDVIGIVLFVFPHLAEGLVKDESLTRAIGGFIFFMSFLAANFMLYRRMARNDSSEVELQLKEHQASLDKWLNAANNRLSLFPQITVTIHVKLNIYNHNQRPTHVKLVVTSVDAEWELAGKPSDMKVSVDRIISRSNTKSGNPFVLEPGEINDDVRLRAELLFTVPEENGFEYLGQLSHLTVRLGAEQAGKKPTTLEIKCDVVPIHQKIENDVTTRLQHSQNEGNIPLQAVQILKKYWNVKKQRS